MQTKCPVAKVANFVSQGATSILGNTLGGASAHSWLAAGMSGQDVPGRLTSGLRTLHNLENEFLVVTDRQADELALKANAFDTRHSEVRAAVTPVDNSCMFPTGLCSRA